MKKRDMFRKAQIAPAIPPPRRMCETCDKQIYTSERLAKQVARTRMILGASKLRTYECPEHRGWHLTSTPVEKGAA